MFRAEVKVTDDNDSMMDPGLINPEVAEAFVSGDER